MENNVKVTFWLHRTKKNSKNLTPVYIRVTRYYEYFTKVTGVWIHASQWDKKAMRVKGTLEEACTANESLDSLKIKVLHAVNQFSVQGIPFNIHTIRGKLEASDREAMTLMRAFDEQLAEMKRLKGKDFAPATLIKYKNTRLRLSQYIKLSISVLTSTSMNSLTSS